MRVPSLILALGMALGTAAAQTPIAGTVTQVEDGDTLCVGSIMVRLEGIDTPEKKQKCWRGLDRWNCGPPATQALRDMAIGRALTCQPKYCDRYDRTVAVCRLDGADLSEAMVAAGWAIDWPYYSGGRYLKAQEDAQKAGRGLWADGGGPTLLMRARMIRPGSRRSRGPWPPCKKLCDVRAPEALAK